MNPEIPKTAQQLHDLIVEVFSLRAQKAGESEYDRGVCLRAVATAREVFKAIPVNGSVRSYHGRILDEIDDLQKRYNDPDGQYTSGKAPIGDISLDIYALLPRE